LPSFLSSAAQGPPKRLVIRRRRADGSAGADDSSSLADHDSDVVPVAAAFTPRAGTLWIFRSFRAGTVIARVDGAMNRSLLSRYGVAFALTTMLSRAAWADPPKVGFEKQNTPKEYPAPLSQTTQPSYVPQSVALSGPEKLDYEPGEPVPPGYTPVQRTRKGPIIAGASVFGSLYLLSAFAASVDADSSRDHDLAPLFIPVAGPFITIVNTNNATGTFFLVIDGLGQSAGLALLIYGLTSPKTVLLRNDFTASKPSVRVTPMMTASTTGVGLTGTF
jgi:hypothetical protein